MSARKIVWTIISSALLLAPCFSKGVDEAQSAAQPAERAPMRPARTPSIPYQVLRTVEGRELLKQSTHPEARDILAALGEDFSSLYEAPVIVESITEAEPLEDGQLEVDPPAVSGPTEYGSRFNLEPRTNTTTQSAEAIDFIPSGVANGVDLVVGTGYDQRGLSGGLGGSASGYYVSRDTDKAPEYEGGLPAIDDTREAGDQVFGGGIPWVVADPVRGGFFAADLRFDGTTSAIGLFRSPAATLRDPIACPDGTHTAEQAAACWPTKRLAFARSSESAGDFFARVDHPRIVVDTRLSGVGAGNIYLVAMVHVSDTIGYQVQVIACANDLSKCSPPAVVMSDPRGAFDVSIRPDGKVTVTWSNSVDFDKLEIKYRSCTPFAGVAPVCGPESLVQTETQPAVIPIQTFFANTVPEHDHALLGSAIETYVFWNRCKTALSITDVFMCPDTDIVMRKSSDNGLTWSAMTCVACEPNDQFRPAVVTDQFRNTINVAYHSSQEDVAFQRRLQVYARQIVPTGSFPPAISPAQPVTTLQNEATYPQIGIAARGLTWGYSRLYVHFTYNNIQGRHFGFNIPEPNNHVGRIDY